MARNGNKKKKPSDAVCKCLLSADEKGTPLVPYLKKYAPLDVISNELPPGETQAKQANVPGILLPVAQEILFRVTHMVLRELEENVYFDTLSESNIVVTDSDLPKMVENTLQKPNKGEEATKKSENIQQLKEMMNRVLIGTSPLYQAYRRVNPELSHWLALMRDYRPGRCLFLIKYPFCLIPINNSGPAYILQYDRTMHILRANDPAAYALVVLGVEIPDDWATRCLGNVYLADSLRWGNYDLQATRFPDSTEPRLIPVNYIRNNSSHAQNGAAAPHAARGVKFLPSDKARALYIRFPLAFTSMQKALHFVGEMQKIDGFVDLFPGRLTIPRND